MRDLEIFDTVGKKGVRIPRTILDGLREGITASDAGIDWQKYLYCTPKMAAGSKCKEILPPEPFDFKQPPEPPVIFLAGAIDMGKAVNWQSEIVKALSDVPCVVLNPRRKDWDSSWEQSIDNPQFREQVEWELKGLEQASFVALCLPKDSKAPISLLELGLHVIGRRMLVFCEEGYWRKGNVDVVCHRYGIPVFEDFEAFVMCVKARVLETSAGTQEPVVLPEGTIQQNQQRFVTAVDRSSWRIAAMEFVIGTRRMDMSAKTDGSDPMAGEKLSSLFLALHSWATRKATSLRPGAPVATQILDGLIAVETALKGKERLTGRAAVEALLKASRRHFTLDAPPFPELIRKYGVEVIREAAGRHFASINSGMGDTHPFGSPLRNRPDYGEHEMDLESRGLKLPSEGIMTSADSLRVKVVTDRIVASAQEFTAAEHWDGEVEGKYVRMQWRDKRERDYRLTELPVPGKKRLRIRSGGFAPWLGGAQKREYGYLLMANVVAKIMFGGITYEQAAAAIDREIKRLVDDSNAEAEEPKDHKDLVQGPWETQVFYLEVEPHGTKGFTAEGKDFRVEVGWDKFRAYAPDSDFQQADPNYTLYESKSPTAARKMYKVLRANPDALKQVPWSAFGGWLKRNGIGYDTHFSQWR